MTQTTSYGSPATHAKDLGKTPTGSPPTEATNRGVVGSNWQLSTNIVAISQKRCNITTWLLWNANRNSYALHPMELF